ncbi:MAG TPA: hypothetical protein VNM37_10195 [Candidatus Dormibacteraeota bacterium]|nr:hypothetical protein [Candidatus Dormibacteraeota bacterium]
MNRLLLLLLAGIAAGLAGCSSRDARTRGGSVQGVVIPVGAIQHSPAGSRVVVHGVMKQKCPVAGCWFVLNDATGAVKVDTKNAGFVMVDVPLETPITVAGLVVTNESASMLDATGVRY